MIEQLEYFYIIHIMIKVCVLKKFSMSVCVREQGLRNLTTLTNAAELKDTPLN